MVEVSTGYYADTLVQAGTFNGKPYRVKHENIRPDHLALLPGQVGACSIADGCGAPRVNQADTPDKKTLAGAMSALLKALGLKPTDCNCEVQPMKAAEIVAAAEAVNKKLAAKPETKDLVVNFDVAELEKMSDAGRAAVMGAIRALEKAAAAAKGNEDVPGEEEEDPEAMKRNAAAAAAPVTAAQLQTMIADAVGKALNPTAINAVLERSQIEARLLANGACAFTADELKAMSLEALKKYEKSIRPADYSGAGGGVVTNGAGAGASPLLINSGVMSAPRKKGDGDAAQ